MEGGWRGVVMASVLDIRELIHNGILRVGMRADGGYMYLSDPGGNAPQKFTKGLEGWQKGIRRVQSYCGGAASGYLCLVAVQLGVASPRQTNHLLVSPNKHHAILGNFPGKA